MREFLDLPLHKICCKRQPGLPSGTEVVNTCPGCDRRFRSLYEGVSTISLWEVLANRDDFPFPDYGGASMALHDACPVRTESRVHDAVRTLLRRMNVDVREPEKNRAQSVCCGDDFYPKLPVAEVGERMKSRAAAMPCDDVVVYCVSCVKSMHVGEKKPRYLPDLLFGEPTEVGTFETKAWHDELDRFVDEHCTA